MFSWRAEYEFSLMFWFPIELERKTNKNFERHNVNIFKNHVNIYNFKIKKMLMKIQKNIIFLKCFH